jgi:uncharacterized repeat protein (TIGR03803 family)
MKNTAFGPGRSLLLKLLPLAACWLALAGATDAGAASQQVYPLYSFTGFNDGGNPAAGLVQASDGYFYGTTYYGGTNSYGTVFRVSTNGAFTSLYSFSYASGLYPEASLVQAGDGWLYGTTYEGGTYGYGTVFRISTNGVFTNLYSFSYYTDGAYPLADLVQAGDGFLYGTTYEGGTNGYGTVFRISTNGVFTNLCSFSYTNAAYPEAGLVQASDGWLYGTAYEGGTNGYGALFRISTNGVFTNLYSFNYTSGYYPEAGLVQAGDGWLYGTTASGGAYSYYGTVFRISTNGAFNSLYSFTYSSGGYPKAALAQADNGNLYGTTYEGGTSGSGTVYQISTNGAFTLLYSFLGTNDGANPEAGLIQAANGNLYGTADSGGANDHGSIYVLDALQVPPQSLLFTVPAGGPVPVTSQNITLNAFAAISWSLDNPASWLSLSVSNGIVAPGAPVSLSASPNPAAASLPAGFYSVTLNFTNLNDGTVQSVQVNLQVLLSPVASFAGSGGGNPYSSLIQANDGWFYGTTAYGGASVAYGGYGNGTVFRINSNGAFTTLYSFTGANDGANPYAGLLQASDGWIYGTTEYNGAFGNGTIFRISTNGSFTALYSFTGGNDGANPVASLIQASDGRLYGTTQFGGAYGNGTVFQVSSNGFNTLYSFAGAADGGNPAASLIQANDGSLYGTTPGGPFYGTIFKITTNGAFTLVYSFTGGDDGAFPQAALIQARDGWLYGTAPAGGINGLGTVFRLSLNGAFNPLFSFNGTDGSGPLAPLFQTADGYLYGTTPSGNGRSYSGTIFRITTNGAFNSLHLFTGSDGSFPGVGLIQAGDASLYGTAATGGLNYGTIFKITTNGVFTLLHAFLVIPHVDPAGALQIIGGNLYGTTEYGGTNGQGSVFQLTTNGALSTLASFSYATGETPQTGVIQASDGNLYGTTYSGGTSGSGTVFRLSTNGVLTSLFSFNYNNGANPNAGLVQAGDGFLYGTTYSGGSNGYGTIFRISTNGAFTSLYSFSYASGAYPEAGLVQASDGWLYGTTYEGGNDIYGTIFRISTNGAFASLYSFNYSSGAYPEAGLVQAGNGWLYGTTYEGGTNDYGTVFQISTNGAFSSLYSFTDGYDGIYPRSGLIQAGNGDLYGTTSEGGASGFGTVFQITPGGAFTPFYSFSGGSDGGDPAGGLVAYDGWLYGLTQMGGANGNGTGFALLLPQSAMLPVTIEILSFSGGNLLFSFPTTLSQSYTVQQNTNLATANWLFYTNCIGNGLPYQVLVPTTNPPVLFFRVTEP